MATVTSFDLDSTASGQNESVDYTENGSPILLAQHAAVGATGNFNGQTLTISGLLAEDQIGFAAGVTIAGNSILIGGTTIGTFSGGVGGANLVVTFNSNASASQAQTLLANLTYSSTSDAALSHSLTIDLAGTARSDKVNIAPVNDAPLLDLNGAASGTSAVLNYNPGDPLTKIAPAGAIADIDSLNFKDGSLRVSFSANATATDQLAIITDGVVTLTGAGGTTVRVNGTVIGTVSGGANGSDLVITFTNGNSTPAAVQTLLEHIGYRDTSPTPSHFPRTVAFTLNDGDGTANGGNDTGSATATIIYPNLPPILDLDAYNSTAPGADYATTFVVNSAPVALAGADVLITDGNEANLESVTFTLVDGEASDTLLIEDFASLTALGISMTAAGPHYITLSGSAPLANYEAALQYVEFAALSFTPGTADRHVAVVVNDGTADSNTATATVHVALSAPGSPVLDLDADNSTASGTAYATTFFKNGAAVALAGNDVRIFDMDDVNLESVTFTLIDGESGDALLIEDFAPLTALGLSMTAAGPTHITLSGSAPKAHYEAALQYGKFAAFGSSPTTADRHIAVVINDGTYGSNTAFTTVHVAPPPNIPPVLDLDANDSTAPGTGYATTVVLNSTFASLADTDITITDSDDVNIESMTFTLVDGVSGGVMDSDAIGIRNAAAFNALAALGITPTAATSHSLTLTGSAPAANYQAALQYIAFFASNSDLNVSLADRHVTVTVNDGTADSNTAVATIHVRLPIPIFDLDADNSTAPGTGYATTFVQLGAPVAIADSDVSIITNSGNINGARIDVLGAQPGDVLDFDLFALVALGIIPQRNPNNPASIGLSGSASVENYEAALQLITFSSSGASTADRTIDIVIADGTSGTRAFTTVHVVPNPDIAPVLDLDADDSTAPGTGYATTFVLTVRRSLLRGVTSSSPILTMRHSSP